jgi:hypothetical protein
MGYVAPSSVNFGIDLVTTATTPTNSALSTKTIDGTLFYSTM